MICAILLLSKIVLVYWGDSLFIFVPIRYDFEIEKADLFSRYIERAGQSPNDEAANQIKCLS